MAEEVGEAESKEDQEDQVVRVSPIVTCAHDEGDHNIHECNDDKRDPPKLYLELEERLYEVGQAAEPNCYQQLH